jgi:hypothetical protein
MCSNKGLYQPVIFKALPSWPVSSLNTPFAM